METKQTIKPCTCLSHDEKEGRLNIEVQIPGVEKKDILIDILTVAETDRDNPLSKASEGGRIDILRLWREIT